MLPAGQLFDLRQAPLFGCNWLRIREFGWYALLQVHHSFAIINR